MKTDQYFDELKRRVTFVHKLLIDPQPGLVSWSVAVGQGMTNLVDFWTKEEVVKEVEKKMGGG